MPHAFRAFTTRIFITGERGQFGPASSGRLEARLASGVRASARQAARAALNGSDPTGGAKYFKLASSGHAGTVVGPIVFY